MRFQVVVGFGVTLLAASCATGAEDAPPDDTTADSSDDTTLEDAGADGDELPEGFTPTELGGFRLGAELDEGGAGGAGGSASEERLCEAVVLGVVRDFRRGDIGTDGHPDFQTFAGTTPSLGMVEPELGPDRKPVSSSTGPFIDPANGQQTTSAARFDQWFRAVPGVNRSYELELALARDGEHFTFYSRDFFPLEGAGFGQEELPHNYHFTTELHLSFRYKAGDSFTFTGDDDLWVFIAGQLAIDLGGLHVETASTFVLDDHAKELGLVVGEEYPLELFHAERAVVYSDFRLDTNLDLTGCGEVVR